MQLTPFTGVPDAWLSFGEEQERCEVFTDWFAIPLTEGRRYVEVHNDVCSGKWCGVEEETSLTSAACLAVPEMSMGLTARRLRRDLFLVRSSTEGLRAVAIVEWSPSHAKVVFERGLGMAGWQRQPRSSPRSASRLSRKLPPGSARMLDALATVLADSPKLDLDVLGHCEKAEPKSIAKQRAEAVRDALVARGVEATRLRVQDGDCEAPSEDSRIVDFPNLHEREKK